MKKNIKKRNWTIVCYPESMKQSFDDLAQLGIEMAVSPLHNQDTNIDGEKKKEHYHVILCFPGPTTYNNVLSISEDYLSGVIPQAIESIRGTYRYLTHLDNPEKYQYDPKDIKLYNGFDPNNILSNSDESKLVDDIIELIIKNDIFEYAELVDLLLGTDFELSHIVKSKTIFFNTYLKSRQHHKKALYNTTLKKEKSFLESLDN